MQHPDSPIKPLTKFAPVDKPPAGNANKYLSYREAWTRIKDAQVQGFYFEAITLVESIISDRLTSFLVRSGQLRRQKEVRKYPALAYLIKEWKKKVNTPIVQDSYLNLQDDVDEWRLCRNRLIHSMVRSHPGEPTVDIVDFLEEAKQTAKQGEKLARAVSSWCTHIKFD
jgi:hypothetical protein